MAKEKKRDQDEEEAGGTDEAAKSSPPKKAKKAKQPVPEPVTTDPFPGPNPWDSESGKSAYGPRTEPRSPDKVTQIDPTERKPLDDAKPRFKVVSWNVDGLRAPGRREALESIVKAESPDVLFLQVMRMTVGRYFVSLSHSHFLSVISGD